MKIDRRSLLKGALGSAAAVVVGGSKGAIAGEQLAERKIADGLGKGVSATSPFVNNCYPTRLRSMGFDDLVGRKRFAFLDTRQIREAKGVEMCFHQAKKHGDPVMVGDRPWETGVQLYGSVLHDGEKFRMWYQSGLAGSGVSYNIAYAESHDGLRWDKPDLGIVEIDGSKKNNHIKFRGHSPSVIDLGSAAAADKRYLGIATGYAPILGVEALTKSEIAKDWPGYWAWYSADGIDWKLYPIPECRILSGFSDCLSFTGDPYRNRVLASVKLEPRVGLYDRRSVTTTTASFEDVLSWEQPRLALAADELDDKMARAKGGKFMEFYGMGMLPQRDFIIGFLETYYVEGDLHPSQQVGIRMGFSGHIDIQMVYSYDGYYWHRSLGREALIPLGEKGAWDAGCLNSRGSAVEVGDDVFIYYSASHGEHSDSSGWWRNKIGLAKVKRDRFASIACDGEGMVETYHGRAVGDNLVVNGKVGAGGSIRVEVIAATANWGGLAEMKTEKTIPGFSAKDCNVITGDDVRLGVNWGGKSWKDLPKDTAVALRFYMKNADIFAYEIS